MKSAGNQLDEQLSKGFELALFISPSESELETLKSLYKEAQEHFEKTGEGLENLDQKQTDNQLNSLTVVANAIMNLDAFFTKN